MNTHFILCAERAARTTEGLFVLHGILERIMVKQPPTAESPLTLPTLAVAFEIREANLTQQRSVRVRLVHKESGQVLFDQGFGVEPSADQSDKISGLLNFHLLPLKGLGTYEVIVDVDGVQAGVNNFLVMLAPTTTHGK